MNLLAEILSSRLRAKIFQLLFGLNDFHLHMREIQRRTGFSIGSIQGELKKLTRLDLVKKNRDGNRTYFKANKMHPIYQEIHNLVIKSVGLYDVLKKSLKDDERIHLAFVYGSIVKNQENANSDIDLFVIGDAGLRVLSELLSDAQKDIQREINPFVMHEKEFRKRIEQEDHLLASIMTEPKIFIIGDEHELEKMA